MAPPPPRGRLAHALRVAAWNAALILGGLAVIAAAGEAWLRLNAPFLDSDEPLRFVPGVGILFEPHTEIRLTNGLDFWTATRANSLGFPDREPPAPERAAASCHVAAIGDSFTGASQVPMADKFHVRLEQLAAAALPALDVTTSAWGRGGTAQASQLPFYDEYARLLRPNLVVLVFFGNDFDGSSSVLQALPWGWDPDRAPWAFPERAEDGSLRLRPPDPEYRTHALPWFPGVGGPEMLRGIDGSSPPEGWRAAAARALTERSFFARWLDAKRQALTGEEPALPPLAERAKALAARPGYRWILDGWEPTTAYAKGQLLTSDDPPPVFAEALEHAAWSLAEFRRRADRDGAALVILAVHHLGAADSSASVLLQGWADDLGIPVVSQHDWIVRAGGRLEDAAFRHDVHWNAQGHQWAAEAILDWLRRHPEVCEDAA